MHRSIAMVTTTSVSRPHKQIALRVLYIYTIVSAAPIGLWMLFGPNSFATAFGMPNPDPFVLGVLGAFYTAFAISAALGLRTPTRIAPVFLFQLIYKTLWLVVLFAPRVLHGGLPGYVWILALVFASFVVLDLIALPFADILSPRARVVDNRA